MAKAKTPQQIRSHIRFLKSQVTTAEKNLKKVMATKKKKTAKKTTKRKTTKKRR